MSSQIPFSLPLVTLSFLSSFLFFLSSPLSFLYFFFFICSSFCSSSEQNLTHTKRQKNLSPPHPQLLFSDLPVILCPSPFPRRPISLCPSPFQHWPIRWPSLGVYFLTVRRYPCHRSKRGKKGSMKWMCLCLSSI